MGFNCLKATEPPRGESLLFNIQFPGVPVVLTDRPRKDERLS